MVRCMAQFPGFAGRLDYVPIPKAFYSDVLPRITDSAELLVCLHLFRLLAAKRGYPPAVARHLLLEDPLLAAGFTSLGRDHVAEATRGLSLTLECGVFLQAAPPRGEPVLLLNQPASQRAAVAIERGEAPLPDAAGGQPQRSSLPPVAAADIYTLYEENIGMLTPIIVEQLAEAERDYPPGWIAEAIGIAVAANQRHWRYASAILQRWKQKGKNNGAPKRNPIPSRPTADYSTWETPRRRGAS
ncbi:MAG: DnaD domain protein [Dehalococcoidia bacterium]|nr:DnaD domain protein [Dehalococcoidia bacterium]